MVWEAIFMLVLLKIPIVYLCMVVWWAIRAEPREEQPPTGVRVPDTPVGPVGRSRPPRSGPRVDDRRGRRTRVVPRPHPARGEARR
ncbi:MAG TPA: hypothetical protein VFO26_03810 [Gaiella sp.]|uniref:hypothetical protein n=1 Tax=Gaiella sp. TaxID=2663207 RepID=UPI002D80487C|nr:hypothetical protein [Gaiella sp.]HET9286662.1 hypothetical protein [Gaiella sp.]